MRKRISNKGRKKGKYGLRIQITDRKTMKSKTLTVHGYTPKEAYYHITGMFDALEFFNEKNVTEVVQWHTKI